MDYKCLVVLILSSFSKNLELDYLYLIRFFGNVKRYFILMYRSKRYVTSSGLIFVINSFKDISRIRYSLDTLQIYFLGDMRFLLFVISFFSHFDREKLTLFIRRHSDFSPVLSHSNRIKQFVMLVFINNGFPCFMHGIPIRLRPLSQILGCIVFGKM